MAIKLFVQSRDVDASFRDFVSNWRSLRHPNVQKLYGAIDQGYQLLVCEYMANGSLESLKLQIQKMDRHESDLIATSIAAAFRHLYEAALGVQYLHERRITHGNVCKENILIGSDGIAKLGNFPASYCAQFVAS